MKQARVLAWFVFAIVLTHPTVAAAHNPLPGLEGFYVGLLHPLSTPDQALALVAMALVLGSFAMPTLLPAFGALVLGLLAGLIWGQRDIDDVQWLVGLAAIAAVWAALFPGRGRLAVAVLTAIAGIGLGLASVPAAGPPLDRGVTMAGSFFGAFLATLYLAGLLEYLRNRYQVPWLNIGLRVVAAWIGAIAIIMLASMATGVSLTAGEMRQEPDRSNSASAPQ